MVLDEELKVVFVNSAAESLLHCSAAQIVGTPLNHILLSAQALQLICAKPCASINLSPLETILQLPDNLQEEVDLSVSILENGQRYTGDVSNHTPGTNQPKQRIIRSSNHNSRVDSFVYEVKNPWAAFAAQRNY